MRLPPAPWLLLALLFLVAAPPLARPLLPQHTRGAPALAADPPTQTADITITASGADPQTITVTTGTTVRWRNTDSIAHTITADDGSFSPIVLGTQDSASYVFDAAGAYGYTINAVPAPASTGTIVVTGGAAATTTPSATWTASPSETPSATMTTSPTPSTTSSTTPTRTPSATATDSPSTTPTASSSATSTPTLTATQTPTGTPTSTATATAAPLPPDTVLVTIADTGFVPQVITVTAGMYVEWVSAQPSAVTITSPSGLVGSDPIPPGGSYRMRFVQTGTYGYSLVGSNGFTGSVVVLPAPSPTVGTTATASPTASATSSATATASPTASAFDTATPSATVAVVDIPLSGDPPSPCTPSIQTGGAVRWSNENGADGPTYYLTGLSPSFFTNFGIVLEPGRSEPLTVVVPGTYTYRISSAGRVLVPTATFIVGDTTVPCPTPTSTMTANATPTGTSTPTNTVGAPETPTSTAAANTATATSTDTATPSPSATPSITPTRSATASSTNTPTQSATASPRPSNTPTATPTSSPSATPTASATNTPTHTPMPTATPTWTATPTSTPTPPASPTTSRTPPATAGSGPPPATPTGAAAATPTRAASTAGPTPSPLPRRSSTPAAAPRQRCLVIVPRRATGTLAIDGYARHSRARVDLAITLPIPLSTTHGTLRLHDHGVRLALASSNIAHVRLVCTDLRVGGLGRIGKRTAPFTVEIRAGRHGLTLTASVPARHYRFSGAFHGHLAVRLTHKSPPKHGANGRSSKSGGSAGHGGKKATAPGKKH